MTSCEKGTSGICGQCSSITARASALYDQIATVYVFVDMLTMVKSTYKWTVKTSDQTAHIM